MEEEITKNCWCQFANTLDGELEQVRRLVARFFAGYSAPLLWFYCLWALGTVTTVHVIIIEFSINRDHIQIQCKNSNNGVQQNLSLAELL